MNFLAGILMADRSTIFGLEMILDQPSEIVRHFVSRQANQCDFFKRKFYFINDEKLCTLKYELLFYLQQKIRVFEFYPHRPCPKFKLLKEFINEYENKHGKTGRIGKNTV
jgi:hypothetical protein